MMTPEPPYEIKPVDETTQDRMGRGEVVVGDFLALMTLRKQLTQQERNKAKRERQKGRK